MQEVQTVTITKEGLGLQLNKTGKAADGFAVDTVAPGGAAEGVGVEAGHVLVRVAGKALAGLEYDAVTALLKTAAAGPRPLELGIRPVSSVAVSAAAHSEPVLDASAASGVGPLGGKSVRPEGPSAKQAGGGFGLGRAITSPRAGPREHTHQRGEVAVFCFQLRAEEGSSRAEERV